ncbi:MAG: hypothetical protein HY854_06865 [Burkholderiales bacterium]|nr:hypothetical protein [Burkholderiales bacterium]
MKGSSPPPRKRPAFGNTVPAGDVKELGDETGWAAWNDALEKSDKQFAPTAPGTSIMPPGVDRRYAKTEPAALSPLRDGKGPPAGAAKARALSANEVMVEARKNNRVCPKQRRWAELFGQFPQWVPGSDDLPSPPLTGDSWLRTPALAKRMAFRDHIEWCEKHGCLQQMLAFVKGLPEEEWHHMGD